MSRNGLIACLAAVIPTAGCGPETVVPPCGPVDTVVTRVIDGDTVELEDGDKVRYLMIDTPETTKGHDDCFGEQAAEFNEKLVLGREVTLLYDQECRDKYGRLLAWVEVDGTEVNRLLVERGYACVLFIPPNGEDRLEEFLALEEAAKEEKKGMWAACTEVTCD